MNAVQFSTLGFVGWILQGVLYKVFCCKVIVFEDAV
jgi:hypothetical protein